MAKFRQLGHVHPSPKGQGTLHIAMAFTLQNHFYRLTAGVGRPLLGSEFSLQGIPAARTALSQALPAGLLLHQHIREKAT